jgi:hypothetical protein
MPLTVDMSVPGFRHPFRQHEVRSPLPHPTARKDPALTYPNPHREPSYSHSYGQRGHGLQQPLTDGPLPGQPSPGGKRRSRPVIVGILAGLFVLMAACIAAGTTSTQPTSAPGGAPAPSAPAEEPAADQAVVVYEVTGSKASNITFSTDGARSVSQEANIGLPWRKEITPDRGVAIGTLSAQNAGSGSITCKIMVDGQVVRQAKSSGQFSVVSCTAEPIT